MFILRFRRRQCRVGIARSRRNGCGPVVSSVGSLTLVANTTNQISPAISQLGGNIGYTSPQLSLRPRYGVQVHVFLTLSHFDFKIVILLFYLNFLNCVEYTYFNGKYCIKFSFLQIVCK